MRVCFSKPLHNLAIRVTAIILCTVAINNSLLAGDDKVAQQSRISLDTAVKKVRRQYAGGKVLNTKVENTKQGKVFVIKMISADSRVLHIHVDAQSGKIYK